MGDCVSKPKTNVQVEPQRGVGHRDRSERDVRHRDQPERDVGHRDRPSRDVGHRDQPERDVGHRDRFGRDIGHHDRPEAQRRIGTPDENLLQRRRQDDAMGTIEERKSRFCICFKIKLCNNPPPSHTRRPGVFYCRGSLIIFAQIINKIISI